MPSQGASPFARKTHKDSGFCPDSLHSASAERSRIRQASGIWWLLEEMRLQTPRYQTSNKPHYDDGVSDKSKRNTKPIAPSRAPTPKRIVATMKSPASPVRVTGKTGSGSSNQELTTFHAMDHREHRSPTPSIGLKCQIV